MKHALRVTALIAALGAAGCGGSVSEDSRSAAGGTGGAASGGGGAASGGGGGVAASCTGLDEVSCVTHSGCRADHCSCSGVEGYVGCTAIQAPPTPCPGSCPLMPCGALTKDAACGARVDCHSVFMPGACGCANCCCTLFDHCADGGAPDCTGPASCAVPAPYCANPDCNGTYALSYVAGCFEGCVLASSCLP